MKPNSPRLQKRLRHEFYFKNICFAAILFALGFLIFFGIDITRRALPAFHQHFAVLEVDLDSALLDPHGNGSAKSLQAGDSRAVTKQALRQYFPEITARRDKRALDKILSVNAHYLLKKNISHDVSKIGTKIKFAFPLDDEMDFFMKQTSKLSSPIDIDNIDGLSHTINPKQIAWLLELNEKGLIENHFNFGFFTASDSREAESAGIFSALLGSFWLLLITFILAIPLGILCAIYLTEFAPKNRFTDFIEININNLAAVPSIVFGLLGLAIFLNFFAFPRSTAFVGGLVLALMSMPTIIIVTSTALKSVPRTIHEAALGLGASKMQTIFHHVLPICFPSILTGSIIAIAQALGETAPLIMIGMVAFIIGAPHSPFDASSALPVQIFIWADIPEHGFIAKSAAAILVLLFFLMSFNFVAIILRQKLSKKL